ncbi:hypothetical protein [Corynebacterium sp. HMSC055D05]|uniref:hypothetical protein n=1 Tax=Corynebacterium sp. HMSC055D05 TaxID=1715213 RepID=UPI0008A2BEF4|nr:hypothetical protein [Corynebacterium sp. HMSC055D05]OFL93722.1 hypothetical protein HMPREF2734_00755 [Corynebacterium sp. HMSC055D05]
MKRIATAAVAATVSLTAVATPAFAAEEKPSSSYAYNECRLEVDELFARYDEILKEAKTDEEKSVQKRGIAMDKEERLGKSNSSTRSGVCIKQLIADDDYKSGILGLLIGVPVALVALLGAAAAFSGAIPGVQLPALPF